MTRVSGFDIRTAPCCGERYAVRAYASMNAMSNAFWTDGYREQSLMPNDNGLRKCACGSYYILRDMVELVHAAETDLPRPQPVPGEELPAAIALARSPATERAARLDLWHALNHPYRARYRAHRDAENAKIAPATGEGGADAFGAPLRKWWQKLLGIHPAPIAAVSPPAPPAPPSPAAIATPTRKPAFTVPPFMPTPEQTDNMEKLLALLMGDPKSDLYALEIAELYREMGQFEEAQPWLKDLLPHLDGPCARVIRDLIAERQTAPMRYR